MSNDLIKDSEFKQWLVDLKVRIRQSQLKAAIKVNSELLHLYWDLGKDIVNRQMDSTWGGGFFEKLSKELLKEFPDMKGFSKSNLYYIKQFYLFYSQANPNLHQLGGKISDSNLHQFGGNLGDAENQNSAIRTQVEDVFGNHLIFQIPWRHHVEIFTKCKSVQEAMFYVQKTIKNGWSRAVLMNFIDANLYKTQGKAINNFDRLLPDVQSDFISVP